jgi:serine protease Do
MTRTRTTRTALAVGMAVRLAARLAIALAATDAFAAREDAPAIQGVRLDELIDRVRPAYVFVGGGSGAIISPDGYVITNAHVTRRSKRWKLRTADGEYHTARLMGISPGTDLALLKIDEAEDLPFLPLGDSDKLELGDVVIAVGNPFALGNVDSKPTVTLGVVSALHIDRPHAFDAIQTDTPINPGNSGGPLISLKGELIGVNAQIQTRFGLRQNTGVGYAISSNQVKRFLPALREANGKHVPSGKLPGLVLETGAAKPAVIKEVDDESPAAEAGFRAGDTIRSIGNCAVGNVRDVLQALGRYPIGAEVALTIERPGGGEDAASTEHTAPLTIVKYGRAALGFKFDRKNSRSMAVGHVDPKGPAAKGLKEGDVIVGLRLGRRVARLRSRSRFYRVMRMLRPGQAVVLIVQRKGQRRPMSVRIVAGEDDG